MGEPVFNKNYPDPKAMIDGLHKNNVHLMISVWPYFRPGSPVYDDMDKKGLFIDKTKVPGFHPAGMALYDAFNPAAREYYWGLMNKALFQIGDRFHEEQRDIHLPGSRLGERDVVRQFAQRRQEIRGRLDEQQPTTRLDDDSRRL